jgi:peptidoglycan/xylan/chitin deacetylase (PgdA/CDA1 family)
MKLPRSIAMTAVPAAVAATVAAALGLSACGSGGTSDPRATAAAIAQQTVHPLDNNGSAGSVTFTFDDGPSIFDQALLTELSRLHLRAVFFVFGDKVAGNRKIIQEEVAAGDLVENHTWDHQSFTGFSTHSKPLTYPEITAELASTQRAISATGAPAPTLYRPPYGDINGYENNLAAAMGLRVVMPYMSNPHHTPRIVDSMDWTGRPAAQIVTAVTRGAVSDGVRFPGMDGGSILAFHDSAPGSCVNPAKADAGLCADVLQMMKALPGIVDYMNAHHLGVTVDVPSNATGNIVPNVPVKQ